MELFRVDWCSVLLNVVECCGMLSDLVKYCQMLWKVVRCCGML